MFIVFFFIIAKTGNHPNVTQLGKGEVKIHAVKIHTMRYYSELKITTTDTLKTWVNMIMLNEKSHTQKDTCCMIHSYDILAKANVR